jgi:hypothetical protein
MEEKLKSFDSVEKMQLFLFQHLKKETESEETLFLTLNFPLNYPLLTLISELLINTKNVYDSVVALQDKLLKEQNEEIKVNLVYLLGRMGNVHSSKITRILPEIIDSLLKITKSAKIRLKYHAIIALSQLQLTETALKDLLKITKTGLNEKYYIHRVAYAKLLANIYLVSPEQTLANTETAIYSVLKTTEGQNVHVRNAISNVVSSLLSKAPLNVHESLGLLPKIYAKLTSKQRRLTLIESYSNLFLQLGLEYVETNYGLICAYCIEIVKNQQDYFAFECSKYLLRKVVGKILSESGQLRACKSLLKQLASLDLDGSTEVLKSNSIEDYKIIASSILFELGALLTDLGPAALSIEDDLIEPLLDLLVKEKFSLISLALASCIRDLSLAIPNQITRIMNKAVILMQKHLTLMNSDDPYTINQVIGYGHVLCAVIGIVRHRPLFVAYEDAGTIFGIALKLIIPPKTITNYTITTSQVKLGWALIGSLLTLGPNFVNVHISQLMLSWQSIFIKVAKKEGFLNQSEDLWQYQLFSKDSAMAAMISFVKYNQIIVNEPKVSRRLLIFLNNALMFLNSLIGQYEPLDNNPPTATQILLYEYECSLKSRLNIIFRYLEPSIYEAIYTPLLKTLIDTFAPNPDKNDRFTAPVSNKENFLRFGSKVKDNGSALIIEGVHPTSLVGDFLHCNLKNSSIEDKIISNFEFTESNDLDKHVKIV